MLKIRYTKQQFWVSYQYLDTLLGTRSVLYRIAHGVGAPIVSTVITQLVKTLQTFMAVPEMTLLYTQKHATGPYPETLEFIPHIYIKNLSFHLCLDLPNGLFICIPIKMLHTFLTSLHTLHVINITALI